MQPLPIDKTLPALRDALAARPNVVLHAPTGAGKTTRVPLALLKEPWLAGRRVVMLEPRRLAARAAARHMASLLGESAGETVGYRTRFDTRVGANTRIEVVTEGVLTRLLQHDPELTGYGIVIFDEFHERSLQGDLGLALALDVQTALRPGLRLLVMSATLPGERIAAFLDDAPVVSSAGRSFSVDIHYLAGGLKQTAPARTAAAIERAVAEQPGGVLAFLPGAAEIRKTARLLANRLPRDVLIAPLYGALPPAEQDRAIAPAPAGRRKIVLATNIAESSLTIEDVRVVVDCGLARAARFEPRSGMTRLVTLPIARDSADQRAGRAGRVAAGACYRLWSEAEHARLAATSTPEILEADLAPLMLELARWGVADPADLRWLDPPPAAACAQARDLLVALDALTEDGRLTPHGRRLSEMPTHPRLAHMVARADALVCGATGCAIAALLSEQDVLPADARTVDLQTRLEAVARPGTSAIRPRLERVRQSARQLRERLKPQSGALEIDVAKAGLLTAFAYPDRIAQRRAGSAPRYQLANGRGAYFAAPEALSNAPYLAVADLDGDPREARIYLAAALDADDLTSHFADHVAAHDAVRWDAQAGAVTARREYRLGALLLRDEPLQKVNADEVASVLVDGIRRAGSAALSWTPALRQWQQRVLFLRRVLGEAWPDVEDAALLATLDEWLAPYLAGISRLSQLETVPLHHALNALLTPAQQRELDALAPSHVTVPTGSRISIDYGPDNPVLAVRLQEMFGCDNTPAIIGGRVPLTIHLLSPARRPVQITQDLAGFWRSSYQDVKKDMKGRYPKHPWPDDPLAAEPTRRAKRRR
ncbi:MAG TPA: ATP-dependent helicase HrpB [Gammaproteobacteria bacterium]|nr:ATP-dependent helicase HrpB [Gammaproteobacteria bacterium]